MEMAQSCSDNGGPTVYMYVCMYVRTYVCMYVCMYICMYVRMYRTVKNFGEFGKSQQIANFFTNFPFFVT